MTLHEIQLEFERIYAERYRYDDDMSGARLHALRAVAPMLIAQGPDKLHKLVGTMIQSQHKLEGELLLARAALARAKELDPQ